MKQLTLFESEDTHSNVNTSTDANAHSSGHRIFFPCPTAQKMEIGEARCNHIEHCSECQRLIRELDKEVHYATEITTY